MMYWQANRIAVQQYDSPDPDDTIDWYRDFVSDIHLVAVYAAQSSRALVRIEYQRGMKREHLIQPRALMVLLGPDL